MLVFMYITSVILAFTVGVVSGDASANANTNNHPEEGN